MKSILALLFIMISIQVFSQNKVHSGSTRSIKDFFIPAQTTEKAQAIYRGAISKHIYYISKGAQRYEVLHANMFNGKPTSITTINVTMDKNEVKMSGKTNTDMLETNKKIEFKTPVTLLKLPPSNSQISWSSQSLSADIEKCTATLTTVKHNGGDYEAIKVVKTTFENKIQTIEYYLKGIGLYEVYFFDPGTSQETLVNSLVRIVN